MKALMVLGLGLLVAQAAEPTGTLTLGCEGTVTENRISEGVQTTEPVSMGIIVDFGAGMVRGFNFSVPISKVDETSVTFDGYEPRPFGNKKDGIGGKLDRVTGAMQVTYTRWYALVSSTWDTNYSLKCKPTQRMF
jgi:hypothetical protein